MSVKQVPLAIEQTIDDQLNSVRAIILDGYHQKMLDIEARSVNNDDEINQLRKEIETLSSIVDLNRNVHIEKNIADITHHAAQNDPTGMANALGLVMGLAIHAQVKNDREEIVGIMGEILADVTEHQVKINKEALSEALYPVIFPAVTAAVRDAIRSLQRQIDARLKASTQRILNIRNSLTYFRNRRQGLSLGDAVLRDALPFTVEEIFFIQNGSGLLIDHYSADARSVDSDLISAMLTAIRDFANDAFSPNYSDDRSNAYSETSNEQLNEIHYANRTIIIKSGLEGYCAVVIDGTEPLVLREQLQTLVFNVHDAYGSALNQYNGDPDTVPILSANFQRFIDRLDELPDKDENNEEKTKSSSKKLNRMMWIGILIAILFLTLFIFQMWVNYKVVTQLL